MPSYFAPLAVTLLALFACACRGTAREDALHIGPWTFEQVQERTWRLVELEGRAIQPQGRPTVEFAEDGALSGKAGVNAFFGTYTRDGEEGLALANLGSTRKAGPPELMEQETRMLSSLAAIDSWRVVGESLELRREGHVLLRFVPAAE